MADTSTPAPAAPANDEGPRVGIFARFGNVIGTVWRFGVAVVNLIFGVAVFGAMLIYSANVLWGLVTGAPFMAVDSPMDHALVAAVCWAFVFMVWSGRMTAYRGPTLEQVADVVQKGLATQRAQLPGLVQTIMTRQRWGQPTDMPGVPKGRP